MKNRERMFQSLKKNIVRNSDFSYLTSNVGTVKNNGLRKLEFSEGDDALTACNEEKIERKEHNTIRNILVTSKSRERTMIKHMM